MRIFSLPYVLLAAAFLTLGLGAGAVRTLQLDWYANHKALNTTIGTVDWVKYGFKRGLMNIKLQFSLDDRVGLPQVRLYISEKSQRALMDNPPDSTKKWRRAFMKYPDGSIEKIKVRYRGDNPLNWLFMKKSIRIKTSKKRLLERRRVLNINVPQSDNMMEVYLGFSIAHDAGLLTPRARLVEMFVNDEPYGVLVEYDQPGEVFVRNSGQMPVNLYKGEQAHIERSESIELDLFDNPDLWDKVAVGNDLPVEDFSDLSYFLDLIRRAFNDDESYRTLQRVAPFSVWARYAAFQTLTQNAHNTGYHNQRLLADPWRGEVRPILNDPILLWNPGLGLVDRRFNVAAYRDAPADELEIDTQSLIRVYNSDPAFTLAKYRFLYGFLTKDKLLERTRRRIAETTEPLIISAQRDGDMWREQLWPGFPFTGPGEKLRRHLQQYSADIAKVERWLIERLEATPEARWRNSNGRLALGVGGSAPMDGVSIHIAPGAAVPTRIAWDADGDGALGPGDLDIPKKIEGQTITLDASWLANRTAVDTARYLQTTDYPRVHAQPRPTQFNLVADSPLHVAGVKGRNALTGKPFDLKEARVDDAWPSRRNRPVTPRRRGNLQVWRGEMSIEGTRYVDHPVRIEPGARIAMGPGANLVFRQRVDIAGTAAWPVSIAAADPRQPFGAVSLQGPGTAGSSLRHLHMDNGSGGRLKNIQYTAMLNIHNTSDIDLLNLKLSDNRLFDDMLHVVYCNNVRIDDVDLSNANADAIDVDISKNVRISRGTIENSGNDGIDLMTTNAIIEDIRIAANGDKGISVGEASQAQVRGARIEDNVIGIEVKDGSVARTEYVLFAGNKTQLNAYQKNWRYGTGGTLEVRGSDFRGSSNVITAAEKSSIRIIDSSMIPPARPAKRVVFENVSANAPKRNARP